MNTLMVIGILAILIIGIGAAVYYYSASSSTHGGTGNASTTATTSQSGGGQTGTGTTTTSSGSQVDLSGPWHGTYTTRTGATGEWSFRLRRTTGNNYEGLLRTTPPYGTGDGVLPITVQMNGNSITIGGNNMVTFTGTVNGDSMSGTWRLVSGYDQGTWSGERGATNITPSFETTTTTGGSATTTTTTSGNESFLYNTVTEQPYPSQQPYKQILTDIKGALTEVLGGAKLFHYEFSQNNTLSGEYAVKYYATNPFSTLQSVGVILADEGYNVSYVGSVAGSTTYVLYAVYTYNGEEYQVGLTIQGGTNDIVVVGIGYSY